MANKEFVSSNHREVTLDKFERQVAKTIREVAVPALKEAGYDVRVNRYGDILVKKQHLEDETWEHYFSLGATASHI